MMDNGLMMCDAKGSGGWGRCSVRVPLMYRKRASANIVNMRITYLP